MSYIPTHVPTSRIDCSDRNKDYLSQLFCGPLNLTQGICKKALWIDPERSSYLLFLLSTLVFVELVYTICLRKTITRLYTIYRNRPASSFRAVIHVVISSLVAITSFMFMPMFSVEMLRRYYYHYRRPSRSRNRKSDITLDGRVILRDDRRESLLYDASVFRNTVRWQILAFLGYWLARGDRERLLLRYWGRYYVWYRYPAGFVSGRSLAMMSRSRKGTVLEYACRCSIVPA